MTNNSAPHPAAYAATRHDGWTLARQAHFLRSLAQGGSVSAACAAVGKSCASAYRLRRRPDAAAFAAAWDLCVLPHFAVRQRPRRSRFDRRPSPKVAKAAKVSKVRMSRPALSFVSFAPRAPRSRPLPA